MEWAALFLLGLLMVGLELLVLPGTMVVGLVGAILMFWALLMGMVDLDPTLPLWQLPSSSMLVEPVKALLIALLGSAIVITLLASLLPQTPLFRGLVSSTTSREATYRAGESRKQSLMGAEGETISPLAPGGKARFGDTIVDVLSDMGSINSGQQVRVIRFSSNTPVVEAVNQEI
jgi:membrane-bound serine protease (ClpP class)